MSVQKDKIHSEAGANSLNSISPERCRPFGYLSNLFPIIILTTKTDNGFFILNMRMEGLGKGKTVKLGRCLG